KAHNKEFQYKIFEAMPGGHYFDIMDTNEGSEIRFDIYKFIGEQLNPPYPFVSFKEMRRISYRYAK
ncbi:MAG: S9 family peptidase, partial [Bacteroidales bacterium]